MRRAHPELQLLYHVPNEGKRTWRTGARLKSEGLKPGVPDLCLPVARGKYHGLYVELKRRDQRATACATVKGGGWWSWACRAIMRKCATARRMRSA